MLESRARKLVGMLFTCDSNMPHRQDDGRVRARRHSQSGLYIVATGARSELRRRVHQPRCVCLRQPRAEANGAAPSCFYHQLFLPLLTDPWEETV